MRTGFRGLVLLSALCGLVGVGNTQAPGGPGGSCTVNRLRLRIATGDDDLRGGQDNLNVIVFFTNAKPHVALNVNKSANWPNNSVNSVDIFLNPPVLPSEIQALRFVHLADGGINMGDLLTALTPAAPIKVPQAFQSPDNWNMVEVTVSALGNGVGARIATFGYHRFTGSDPVLTIPVQIPVDICSSGRPTGNSGSGSTSGSGSGGPGTDRDSASSGLQSIPGDTRQARGGSVPGALTNQDVVRMAKAHIPESAIIASIQTRPAKFDLSPEGLIALKRAGASQSVLQAMVSHSSGELVPAVPRNGSGKVADELNPQPYPPKARADASAAANADELNPQPYPPKAALLNSGGQQTMLERQANAPSGNGSKSALIPAVQQPTITDEGKQVASAMPATGQPAGGDPGTNKVPGKAEYEPITVDRGVTNDTKFNEWTNTTKQSNSKIAAPPQTTTAAGPTAVGSGTLNLNGGANSGSARTVAPPPQTATAAGATVIGAGSLNLNNGNNTGNSKTVAPPQMTTPAGPTVVGTGTLNLNSGTNSGRARIVQPSQATTPAALPSERQASTSVAQSQPAGGGQLGAKVTETRVPLALNSASVQAACAQDPTPRILGVTPSSGPIIFGPGRQYVVWGCSFGPANPNNAVYLSNGSSFTWYLHSSSWSSNAIAVSFSLASSGAQDFQKTYGTQLNNLMLFVIGQNGNSKLNGVTLSAQ